MSKTKATRQKSKIVLMTENQALALYAVQNGADVYAYDLAKELRTLQRVSYGKFVSIGKAVSPPKNGAERQPYFGAIATKAGIALARKILGPKAAKK